MGMNEGNSPQDSTGLLRLTPMELMVIRDALMMIAYERRDDPTTDAEVAFKIHDRLEKLDDLSSEWARQWVLTVGRGRTQGRPQG